MQHAEVEFLGVCEMRHTRDEGLPERPIIGPCGKDFVDGCVVDSRLALGVAHRERNRPFAFSCFRSFNFSTFLFTIHAQYDNTSWYTARQLSSYSNIVFSCVQLIVLSR
jgi:hypothetical protein